MQLRRGPPELTSVTDRDGETGAPGSMPAREGFPDHTSENARDGLGSMLSQVPPVDQGSEPDPKCRRSPYSRRQAGAAATGHGTASAALRQ